MKGKDSWSYHRERQRSLGSPWWWQRAFISFVFLGLAAGACGNGGGGGGSGQSPVIPPSVENLKGQVSLPDRISLDSDNADPNNPQVSNNNPNLPQPLDKLVSVAGHANTSGDQYDYYSLSMNQGESILLKIADQGAGLDLYLFQGDTTINQVTLDALVKKVTAKGSGSHKLLVKATGAGSIYNLGPDIGTSGSWLRTVNDPWPKDAEFVAGEAIVKLKGKAPRGAVRQAAKADDRGSFRRRVYHLAGRNGLSIMGMGPRRLARLRSSPGMDLKQGKERSRKATLEMIRELSQDPEVAFAEPNFIIKPTVVPDDSYFYLQWNLEQIWAPSAWDACTVCTGSTDIIVAVIDTGLLYDHPDLAANVLKDNGNVVGYDMISDPETARDGDGPDPDPYDPGDLAMGGRSSFHGTHVAGIVAAVSDNNKGVAGVAWYTRLMPIRVLGKGGGTTYDLVQAIYYAAGLANDRGVLPRVGGVVTPAHVINLSLGGSAYSQSVKNAVAAARGEGVIVVAAAGNESSSSPYYPAAYEGVIGISAVDILGSRAYYSNYGSFVDLAAPGGDMRFNRDGDNYNDGILSTWGSDLGDGITFKYTHFQGTSMAAPHVSGVASLMKAAYRAEKPGGDLSPWDMDDLIDGTLCSDTIGSITDYPCGQRDDDKGYGLIDAEMAINAARALAGSSVSSKARLRLYPRELSFGFSATLLETQIINRGTEPLGGLTVEPGSTASASWLSSDIQHLQGDTILSVSVDRSGLAEGAYTEALAVGSVNGGTDTATVTVLKGAEVSSDAGIIYIVLIDPDSLASLFQASSDSSAEYAYTFSDVEDGDYIVSAGTDLDNDGYLGDNGELFGLYPSLEQPKAVSVAADEVLADINFPVQFVGLPIAPQTRDGSDKWQAWPPVKRLPTKL